MKLSVVTSVFLLGVAAVSAAATGNTTPTKEWSYRDTDAATLGPSKWGSQYPSCKGTKQSPITINPKQVIRPERKGILGIKGRDSAPLKLSGKCETFELHAEKNDYVAEPKKGNCKVKSNGKEYRFSLVHFHLPAEHKFGNKTADGELHFVHKNDKGTAVVALLFKATKKVTPPNFFTKLYNGFNNAKDGKKVQIEAGDFHRLVDKHLKKHGVYSYTGSFTTPPCTETVDWWIIRKPLGISFDDLKKVKALQSALKLTPDGMNARPSQPLNSRNVTWYD